MTDQETGLRRLRKLKVEGQEFKDLIAGERR
jgi:hypothetical protein